MTTVAEDGARKKKGPANGNGLWLASASRILFKEK